jgi:hypothetical protein
MTPNTQHALQRFCSSPWRSSLRGSSPTTTKNSKAPNANFGGRRRCATSTEIVEAPAAALLPESDDAKCARASCKRVRRMPGYLWQCRADGDPRRIPVVLRGEKIFTKMRTNSPNKVVENRAGKPLNQARWNMNRIGTARDNSLQSGSARRDPPSSPPWPTSEFPKFRLTPG